MKMKKAMVTAFPFLCCCVVWLPIIFGFTSQSSLGTHHYKSNDVVTTIIRRQARLENVKKKVFTTCIFVPRGTQTILCGSGKGGMDAFDAQMKAMATVAGSAVEAIASEMLDATRGKASVAAATTPADQFTDNIEASSAAISMMETSQGITVGKIAKSIPDLAFKPDASQTFMLSDSGCRVRLDASDAPGPANIAWLSDLCVESRLSSLTAYCGPLTIVPHLISRCSILPDGKTMNLFIDFRPRAYGAYEMRDPTTGNYPGPDILGRKSFEYSGARKDYETKFGTEDVALFLNQVRLSLNGVTDNTSSGDAGLSELETLTRGPLALDITMPLSAGNVDAIVSARIRAADLWLEWALDASHRHKPGAPVNAQYVYDSKYKINAYGVLLDVYTKLFGRVDGERLAAADSGPIDEAYVGGGS